MNRTHCDVAVILALQEEYLVVAQALGAFGATSASAPVPVQTNTYYEFTVPVGPGKQIWVLTYGDNERDKSGTRTATDRLLTRWAPNVLVSLGLSGAISEDINLGDTVVATSVEDYFYRGKVAEAESRRNQRLSFESISMGGKPYPVHQPFVKDFEHAPTAWADQYKEWQRLAQSRIAVRMGNRPAKRSQPSRVHTGPLACGPLVVSHPGFKKWLKDKVDRNLAAVDTESSGVLAAAVDQKDGPQPRVIVIRGVSDHAARKSATDRFGKGAIREWALQNSIDALFMFAREVLAPREQPASSLGSEQPSEQIHQHVIRTWFGGDAPVLTSASLALFRMIASNVTTVERTDNIFDDVATTIDRADSTRTLLIDGAPGTGKSWFLTLLYARLRERHIENPRAPVPILIDVSLYDRTVYYSGDAIERRALDLLRSHLAPLREQFKRWREGRFVLLLDGLDNYQKFREVIVPELVGFGSEYPMSVVRVVGARPPEYGGATLGVGPTTQLLTLNAVRTEPPEASQAFAECYGAVKRSAVTADEIIAMASRYQIASLDLWTLGLLVAKHMDQQYREAASLSEFLRIYCDDLLKGADSAREAAILAFRYYVQRERDIPASDIARQPDAWRLVHTHPLVRDFLVARHVVDLVNLCGGGASKSKKVSSAGLEYVYPSSVMRRAKELINAALDTQWRAVTALDKAQKRGSRPMLTILCYFAGRLIDNAARAEAKELLRRIATRLDTEMRRGAPADREFLMLSRTVYISLMYLRETTAASRYVDGLLRDRRWDSLNRGFHLEYYGDISYEPTQPMSHEDELFSCPRTFEHLIGRVGQGVRGRRTELYEVETYTLCSLARHRHAAGKLDAAVRTQVRDLLLGVLGRPELLPANVRDYVRATEIDLEIDRFCCGGLAEVLLQVKENKRVGWQDRGISAPESIADHIYGAYLLGLFFLPEQDEPQYDKRRILDMILVHDLAETITGDVPAPRKSEEDRSEERQWMSYLSLAGTYADMADNVPGIYDLWQSFETGDSINARVAADIDKIENLVQLYVYRNDGHVIDDFTSFQADLCERIQTGPGIAIRNLVLKHFAGSERCSPMEVILRRLRRRAGLPGGGHVRRTTSPAR